MRSKKRTTLKTPSKRKDVYTVYTLRCRDGRLHTGVAKDFPGRLREHELGKYKNTRSRLPVECILQEPFPDLNSALKREIEIKKKQIKTPAAWLGKAKSRPVKRTGLFSQE